MPNPPVITNSQERIQSILNDTQAIFPVDANVTADGHYGEWRAVHSFGAVYTLNYDSIINQEALAQGVNANLVKAIMYTEFSQGSLYGVPAQAAGLADSLYPMNIRPDIWQGLVPGGDFSDPTINIRAGITLIKRIQERVPDGSIEQVATLYNSLAKEQVTGYGARVKTVYDNQLWTYPSDYPAGYDSVTAEEYFGITTITNIWDAIGGFDSVLDLVDPDIGFIESIALNIVREGSFLGALMSIFDSASISDPQINAPTSSSNFFNIFNDAGGSAYDSSDWDLPGWQNGIVFDGGNYSLSLDPSILNGDGMSNVSPSYFLSNGNRPGAQEISAYDAFYLASNAEIIWDTDRPNMFVGSNFDNSQFFAIGVVNNYQGNANTIKNIDPLVLDLNGNGIELKSYQDANVLFNMDTDSYKEQTGWAASTDGFLVHDKNNDGVINNITEMFSEFYTTGVSNGLQALATLDSNSDGVFNASDAAFAQVRVWQDANGNGQTDAGELKTLASLNITSISLNGTPGNGAVIEGNEVQVTSTMTMNGVSRAVAAINLLANPAGHEWTISSQGVTINSEVGKTSFNVSDANGATVNVATLGVNSAYGNVGNDTLIGDGNSNWLGGGAGSDTITAGAGDDVLIIDAQDSQDNIDGGAGFDIVQAVGTVGVNFNLSQSNVELATGTNSDDVLVGGGTASVFISGGGGNDIVIGSGANDSLSGNDGNDMLDGGYGDDIIRGHRGDDLIIGGFGNDILEGGLGNDVINGGDGNDVLKGGGGTDTVDGGNGTDIVELTGSYSQYTRSVLTDGSIQMVDNVANRDGTVVMKNVEQFNFRDMVSVNVNAVNPFPVDDRVIINTSGPQEIQTWYLLGNDIDYQGGSIHITELSDAVGGTVSINGFGVVTFTPTAGYNGVMSFKYKMADAQNNPGATVGITGTTASAEMRATVYLNTANQPTDPLFNDQWYLSDANIIPVWNNYTGANVKVGIFDSGIFDPTHSDLAPNTDAQFAANYDSSQIKTHGTLVAGVVGSDRNSQGGVGVAYGATLTGVAIADPESSPDYAAMSLMKNYDVVNNSWVILPPFSNTFLNNPSLASALSNAVNTGRNGLGTILVFAAGNDRGNGGDSNDSYANSSRLGITVGAINKATDLSVLEVGSSPFSSPGASILISAPGSNIQSTSRLYQNSEGDSFGGTYEETRGTSFATPVVSGVVALMLEANPNLHYYDVQKILAYSARMVTDAATTWNYNTAKDWNGGGLHFSNDYGFGNIDALAAVRLAETWNTDPRNNAGTAVQSPLLNAAIPDGTSNLTSTINSPNPFQIVEYAEVQLNLNHTQLGDLVITLIAPNGTQSVLLNRNGKVPGSSDATDRGHGTVTSANTLVLVSTHHFGETGGGNWQLKIEDKAGGQVGTLESWQLKLFGKLVNSDDVYIYTNEFSTASGSRLTLTDASGNDTLNAAAVSSNSVINLNAGTVSTIASKSLTINSSTSIENAYTGDGNDNITGNALDNLLSGGRGDDSVAGGNGNDSIFGGLGADIIDGGVGTDTVYYSKSAAAVTVNLASNVNTGGEAQGDNISNVENIYGSNYADLLTGDVNANTISGAAGDDTIYGGTGNDVLYGEDGNDWLVGQAGADTLDGGNGNNSVANDDSNAAVTINLTTNVNTGGYAQGDSLINIQNASGSAFNDSLTGDANDNIFYGRDGNDSISSLAGNDTIYGGNGADNIASGDGSDWLAGEAGADTMDGGNGSDYAYYGTSTAAITVNLATNVNTGGDAQGDSLLNIENVSGSNLNDTITGDANANIISAADGNDTLVGGAGADTLDGGNGIDTVDYSSSGTAVTINLVTNVNTGGDAQGDLLANIENVTGSAFNDSVTGNTGTNILVGGADNDTLNNGAGGSDTLTGGSGADTFVVQKAINSNTTITDFSTSTVGEVILLQGFTGAVDFASLAITQSGSNTIITLENGQIVTLQNVTVSSLTAASFGGGSTITGTADDDSLYGTVANDNIQALGGNDWIFSSLGADTIDGGSGTDGISYSASTVAVTVNMLTNANTGGDAAGDVLTSVETIVGSSFNDSIIGDANANTLYGGNGNDTLNGGDGNDWLQGEAGADTIDGGNGTDTVSYTDSTVAVIINLATNINTGGTAQGDSISNIENVFGSNYNDSITGTSGANSLYGLDGNDTLVGGAGADTLDGGNGTDTVSYAGSSAAVNVDITLNSASGGDAQGDVIANFENISGSSFADTLTGNSSNNALYGMDGNDWLYGGLGADTLDGGNGTDGVSYAGSAVAVTVNLLTNTNTGGDAAGDILTSVETITGSAFNDSITGDANANTLYGGNSNDALNGGDGNDWLQGEAGTDTIDGGNGTDTVSYSDSTAAVTINLATNVNTGGSAQGDSITNTENVYGSSFNDTITGTIGANTISGVDGNDMLIGGAGTDTLDGGNGTDTVSYSASTVAVTVNLLTNVNTGGDAQGDILTSVETIVGSSFNDSITGDANANTLYGGNGNDTLTGGDGNDWLEGNAGSDTIDGGNGTDTISFQGSTAAIALNLATNINTGGTAQGDSISNVENIYASNFNDTITGTSGANSIYGLDGNDTLIGGAGADTLDGGNGTDIVSYASSSLAVVINLATNVNTGGDAQGDSLLNIESVTGSSFNDLLNGNSGANTLSGGGGNDWLYGNAGADVLNGENGTDGVSYSSSTSAITVNLATNANTGGDAQGDTLTSIETVIGSSFNDNITGSTGANTLYGANGNDTMNGGGGNDWIQGEAGVDTMTGGTGNDTFQYSVNSDSGIGVGSRDIITDFATGDIIRLTDFAGTFAFRGTGAFTGTANEVNYTQTGGNTIISVDSNGNGVADFQIEVTGLRTMVQGDFAL